MTAFDDTLIAAALQSDYVESRDRGLLAMAGGQTYLTANKHGRVRLRSLNSLETLAEADWKSINPPVELNHREFRSWVSHSTGKCLTVFKGKSQNNQTLRTSDCKFDGSNLFQLFAFRFHYHKTFCCCGIYDD
ncbi:hypothetical protein FEM48_Zijuj01G0331900 [Ziziphus jujuba var. spinosa]|uniref:Uncharacterized protein n=1 Tax=Ziziphus jujuba var. spinosa TaxID=714518 RepID=A0A978W6R2_ZIZJJ|nr:hypothetical protein FEM48_Zijuj01G0331900 [Ziziphus jujuba var. spinosa]